MATEPAGWYADPTGRHTYRYWDGTAWSNQVSDGGTTGVDPTGLDANTASTPPAPGTKAPGSPQERTPTVQVSQRAGGGFGMGTIVGVLVGVLIVAIILVVLLNNLGDDGSTPSTDAPEAPVTTVDSG